MIKQNEFTKKTKQDKLPRHVSFFTMFQIISDSFEFQTHNGFCPLTVHV